MKANWKRTLLSLVLCAGFVWPAGAVSTGQPAASQTGTSTAQSKPAAYTCLLYTSISLLQESETSHLV